MAQGRSQNKNNALLLELYGVFDECRDWPLGLIFSYQLYIQIGVLYMKSGNENECLNALDKAARLAARADSLPTEGFPSSLLINRINFKDLSGTNCERTILREEIEAESAFESIRKTPEYKRIMAKLMCR